MIIKYCIPFQVVQSEIWPDEALVKCLVVSHQCVRAVSLVQIVVYHLHTSEFVSGEFMYVSKCILTLEIIIQCKSRNGKPHPHSVGINHYSIISGTWNKC